MSATQQIVRCHAGRGRHGGRPNAAPCRVIAPMIDELAWEMAGSVRFAKLKVDQNSTTAARFNVSSTPTLVVLKGGQ